MKLVVCLIAAKRRTVNIVDLMLLIIVQSREKYGWDWNQILIHQIWIGIQFQ